MDFLPVGLAFVSGLTGGVLVLHHIVKHSNTVAIDLTKPQGRTSSSRATTRDAPSSEVSTALTTRLSNLEQQVSLSMRRNRIVWTTKRD